MPDDQPSQPSAFEFADKVMVEAHDIFVAAATSGDRAGMGYAFAMLEALLDSILKVAKGKPPAIKH